MDLMQMWSVKWLRLSNKVPGVDYVGRLAGYADLGQGLSLIKQECRQASCMHGNVSYSKLLLYRPYTGFSTKILEKIKCTVFWTSVYTHYAECCTHIILSLKLAGNLLQTRSNFWC